MGDRCVVIVRVGGDCASCALYSHWGGEGILQALLRALNQSWPPFRLGAGQATAELVRCLDSLFCESVYGVTSDASTEEEAFERLSCGDAGVVVLDSDMRTVTLYAGYLEERHGRGPHALDDVARKVEP